MQWICRVGLLVAVLVLGLSTTAQSANVAVSITAGGFDPATISLRAGSTLTWTNNDTAQHQLTAPAAGLSSPVLAPTDTFSFAFTHPGSFVVTDPSTPSLSMRVTVAAVPVVAVSLHASTKQTLTGKPVELGGSVTGSATSRTVDIAAKPCGNQRFATVKTVPPDAAGRFRTTLAPVLNTVYRARYGNAVATAAVAVRARLELARAPGGALTVRTNASTGIPLTLQWWDPASHTWKSAESLQPRTARSFKVMLTSPKGTKLRLVSSHDPCLAPSVSNSITLPAG